MTINIGDRFYIDKKVFEGGKSVYFENISFVKNSYFAELFYKEWWEWINPLEFVPINLLYVYLYEVCSFVDKYANAPIGYREPGITFKIVKADSRYDSFIGYCTHLPIDAFYCLESKRLIKVDNNAKVYNRGTDYTKNSPWEFL